MEIWIIWLIFAIVLMVIEIFTPAFLFGLFSIGAVITSLIAYLFPKHFYLQILIFIVLSFLLVIFVRKIFIKYFGKKKEDELSTNIGSIIGKRYKITEKVNNDENTGAIIISGVRWRVVSNDSSIIEIGIMIEVTDIDGTKLIVRTINE